MPTAEEYRAIQRGLLAAKSAVLPVHDVHQEVVVYITVPREVSGCDCISFIEEAHLGTYDQRKRLAPEIQEVSYILTGR